MDEALVEHAQHDVDRDRGGEDQPGLAGERLGEFGRVAGIAADHRARHADLALGLRDHLHRVAERGVGGEIEADRDGRELLLVGDDQRGGPVLETGDGAQWHLELFPTVGMLVGEVEVNEVDWATAWSPVAGT